MRDFTFPVNELGLVRGSILESAHVEVERQLGIKVGDRIPIGFDGTFVRCQGLTWEIRQLVEEINAGYWKIIGMNDLSDPVRSADFAWKVEMRDDM